MEPFIKYGWELSQPIVMTLSTSILVLLRRSTQLAKCFHLRRASQIIHHVTSGSSCAGTSPLLSGHTGEVTHVL